MRILKPRPGATATESDAHRSAAPPAPARPTPAPAAPTWPGRELLNHPITAQVLLSVWNGDPVVLVPSPPGAGKTRLVVLLSAALAHRAGLRVGIAAQTRAQAVDIARRLGAVADWRLIGLLWKKSGTRPDTAGCPLVFGGPTWPRSGGAVRIATTAKWLRCEPDQAAADVLIVDEAYQATYADVGALGAMARQIVCVGDPGQIDPVVTGDVSRWVDSPTGPHRPAPSALAAAYPNTVNTVALRHTWRLGPVTTGLVQPVFYPDLPFVSRRPVECVELGGVVVPEVACRVVGVRDGCTDAGLMGACVDRVRGLLAGGVVVDGAGARRCGPGDVAVVVSRVGQAAWLRAVLADVAGVLVGTANGLQGVERPVVVAVHPLAGCRGGGEGFGLDSGRLCVMLSRHRAHLSVLVDAGSAAVLDRLAAEGSGGDGAVARSRWVWEALAAAPVF